MNIFTIYNGISTLLSGAALLVLFMIDASRIADAVTLSHLVTYFASVEFVKYVVVSLVFDVNRVLDISTSTYGHGHSGQKTHSEKRVKKIFKSLFLLLVVSTFYHIVVICLGASALDKFEETMLFCVLLTVLSFLPLCCYLGPNLALGVLFNYAPAHTSNFEAMLRYSLYITLFGAWLGAFVIPLDWDRPWQVYPIPCIFGTVSTYCIFHAASALKGLIPTSKSICV